MSRKVDSFYKLFVGNLPWTIGNTELKKYFSQFGHVTDAAVAFDRYSGLSRGFGYVAFTFRHGYTEALDKKDHMLEGRLLSLQHPQSIEKK